MSDDSKTTTAAAAVPVAAPAAAIAALPQAPTGMKFAAPSKTASGHAFAINADGTFVQLTFNGVTLAITGADAKSLRDWLAPAALRTPAEAAALLAPHDS